MLQFFFCCCCLFARWMSFLHGSSFYHFICYCLLILLQFGPNSVQSINSNNNTMVKICIISPGPLTHVRNTFSRWRSISTMAGRTHNILALLFFVFSPLLLLFLNTLDALRVHGASHRLHFTSDYVDYIYTFL